MVLSLCALSLKESGRQEYWLGQLLYIGNYLYCEEQQGNAGYLLFGGMLLGDTFHTIPLLNWLTGERRRQKIIWWSGTYERPAIEFLQNFYPIEARFFKDGVPWEIRDRDKFIDAQLPRLMKLLKNVPWETVPFPSQANRCFNLKNADRLGAVPGDFIVIHPASRHSWKNIPAVHDSDWRQFGIPVVTVGAPGEFLIPGSLDLRGRPLLEVARVLASARLFVGIHSSMACLSLYLGRPAIVCAPAPDPAYARFGDLNPQVTNLILPKETELMDAVSWHLGQSETWALPVDDGQISPVNLHPFTASTAAQRGESSWIRGIYSRLKRLRARVRCTPG
jgi:hypothetical protein